MIAVGDEIGAVAIILWVVAMIFIGVNLLRYLGGASMLKVAQDMRAGHFPVGAIADGMLKGIGAVLLIIPGFITDFIALLCFIPLIRRLLFKRWAAKMSFRPTNFSSRPDPFKASPFEQGSFGKGNVYDHDGSTQTNDGPAKKGGALIEQDQATDTPDSKKN